MAKRRVLSSSLRWLVFRLRRKVVPSSPLSSVEYDVEYLRELLRACPTWSEGHLQLGLHVVKRERQATAQRDPRAVATIRVSAQAAIKSAERAADRAKVEPRARYLLGMAHFLGRNFEAALEEFQAVLDPAVATNVPVSIGLDTLEQAGAAAIALGDLEAAEHFFRQIPVGLRSADTATAVAYLEAKAAGTIE
ncbi:MAG: hypothetical protein KDD69_14980 [Bdellovibrionales bacterium]|nr:hypothetical protein [Bdellovibrionales bacterium]